MLNLSTTKLGAYPTNLLETDHPAGCPPPADVGFPSRIFKMAPGRLLPPIMVNSQISYRRRRRTMTIVHTPYSALFVVIFGFDLLTQSLTQHSITRGQQRIPYTFCNILTSKICVRCDKEEKHPHPGGEDRIANK
jgi:uncharacterized protein Veg